MGVAGSGPRKPVAIEDAVGAFMRDIGARNWPTENLHPNQLWSVVIPDPRCGQKIGDFRSVGQTPSVFVRYSSQDRGFAAPLIAEPRRLGAGVWDYTDDPIQEGCSIPEKLRTRIKRCEWFIVVLSSSVDLASGESVRAEIPLPLERTRQGDLPSGHVLPIVLNTSQPDGRGYLEDISGIDVNPGEKASVQRLIIRLCDILGVQYQVSVLAGRWLGLARRLQDEVYKLQLRANESIRMTFAIHSIALHFSRQEWSECEGQVQYLRLFRESALSIKVPYFALLIEGTCQHWGGAIYPKRRRPYAGQQSGRKRRKTHILGWGKSTSISTATTMHSVRSRGHSSWRRFVPDRGALPFSS